MSSSERRATWYLMLLMFVGMILETLGVGFVIPVMITLTQDDITIKYPFVKPILDMLGNPTKESLVILTMLALLFIYMIVNIWSLLLKF